MHPGSHGDGGPGICTMVTFCFCTMVTFCLSIFFFLATRHLYEIPVKALKLELEDGSAVRWNSLAWRQVPLFLGNT